MKMLKAGIMIVCMLCMSGPVFAADEYSPCSRVPLQEARDAMISDSEVSVTQVAVASWGDPAYYYELKPNGITPQDGLIIYPGANVDERSYAVLARDIAKAGFFVALVPMPSCIAIFDNEGRASDVIANNPGITTWSIGGHSLGGVAAGYMITCAGCANMDKVTGVVLWASYPDAAQPLTDKPVKVISIWGTNDALTTETQINNSKPNLPSDTVYVGLKGANHTQFGWYGLHATDYDYLSVGTQSKVDNPADITRQEQHNLILSYTVSFLDSLMTDASNIPAAVDEVIADDGSVWEKVSAPGFIDRNNTDIVALTPYKGNLYALTRNDETGFEIWKTNPAQGWQRIHVQGFTDQSNYKGYLAHPDGFDYFPPEPYNPMMNIWGDMIEFKGKLYVGVSTGYQGSALFGSSGALIWRTDGVAWEPVIGGHAPTATGTLSAISGCSNTATTAVFTDSTKSWPVDSLAGCTIKVAASYTAATHGEAGVTVPGKRLFRINSNTATELTVHQSEIATATSEKAWCAENDMGGGDAGRPWSYLAGFTTGAAYEITCGEHSQGFGDPWNKSIIDFEILNDELYASIGLNYKQGARVMKTSDGLTWAADSLYSFGNIHGYDWSDGNRLMTNEECAPGATKAKGSPVSSSATKMVKTSVTGAETLLIGGTGTAGCNGRGARIYRRDGDGLWTPIVDYLVDSNFEGSNESGFGWNLGSTDFFTSAFQAWSWAEYDSRLFVGVAKLEAGGMIYTTDSASEDDGAWGFSMGGADRVRDPVTKIADSTPDPAYNGFGDVLNTGFYLHNYNDMIYVGTLVTNQSTRFSNPVEGAEIWKGSGPGDAINWTRVSGDGLGDSTVLQFQSFADYNQKMYLVASTVNSSNFRGNEPTDYTGAVVYRLAEEATECLDDSGCSDGYQCVEGVCEPIPDDPPQITSGPFLAAGPWPLLPTSPESAFVLDENYDVLWTFSDDFASCSGDCTHTAEYQALGGATWTALDVTANAANGRARVTLPIESLQNATTYALRFAVTDCAAQTTESNTYYFRVAVTDEPPVITGGPWLAAGSWPLLPTALSSAFVLDQNYDVLWTFSDDYASCAGLCTHRARYRKIVDDGSWIWTWLPVTTDATGMQHARVTLPIESMQPGDYMFYFDVRDCAGQRTSAPKVYYFKVEADN